MKKSSSFIAITICLMFLAMFPMLASANTNQLPSIKTIPTITQENVQDILKSAQQGNEYAIKSLNNLDCFNPEKIQQKGILEVSSKERSKEYFFDDGSSITMSVGRQISPSALYYTDYGMHQWKVAGVEIARYTIYHKIEIDGNHRTGRTVAHWDEGEGLPGVYNVIEYGTELYSGDYYDVCWRIRGAAKYVQTFTGVSSPKYRFEFFDDVKGNSHTLRIL